MTSVAGGDGNHAEWAWLTGSRVVQDAWTPLHHAAYNGHEAAIEALVEAKADVHVKGKVRWGVLGGRGGAASGLYFTIAVRSFGTAVLERPNP